MKYIIEQYLAGRSLESLAREFGVSKSTIANDLRLAGVKRRPRGRPRKEARAAPQSNMRPRSRLWTRLPP